MSLRARLLVFGYPLLEVATAYLVAVWIGWGWMFLLLLAGIPAGFAVMRNAGDAALRDLQRAQAGGVAPQPGRHATAFVAGLLILIPGFWTDLLGVLLLIPFSRRLFTRRGQSWLDSRVTTVRMPGVRFPAADVVQGTVIYPDDLRSPREEPPAPGTGGSAGQLPPG